MWAVKQQLVKFQEEGDQPVHQYCDVAEFLHEGDANSVEVEQGCLVWSKLLQKMIPHGENVLDLGLQRKKWL